MVFRGGVVHERGAALLGATADGEDDPAVAGRSAFGLEHVHGVFSGHAADGLRVCFADLATGVITATADSRAIATRRRDLPAVFDFKPFTDATSN